MILKMSELKVFRPVNGAPTATVVMPSILAGCIETTSDNPEERTGDLAQRAQKVADVIGVAVIALRRTSPEDVKKRRIVLGLPKSLDASEYTAKVAENAVAITDTIKREGCLLQPLH